MPSLRSMPVVKAVLFDLYGTLVDVTIDTDSPQLWTKMAEEFESVGVSSSPEKIRERYHWQVDSDRREHGEPFVLSRRFFHHLLGNETRVTSEEIFRIGRRFRELSTRHISLRDYALPLFAALRRSNCLIGLVSNTDATLTSHDLDVLGIRDHLDTVVLSSDVGVKKPDIRIFRIAMERLRVTACNTIHIGDDYAADFIGALGAKLRPILLGAKTAHGGTITVRPHFSDILRALQQSGWG